MFLFLFLLLQQFITSFLEVNPISDACLEVKLNEWTQKHVPWWKDIESAIPPHPSKFGLILNNLGTTT